MTEAPPVAGLILAAGQSTRFGSHKLLAPLDGTPLIRRTAQSWLASRISKLYVVTGHGAPEVAEALDGLDLDLIENPHFTSGMASSMARGVEAAEAKYDLILIGLGDMPYVKSETLDALIDAAHHGTPRTQLWIPRFEGRRGNPVLWHRAAFPDLLALKGDQGGRQLFQAYETVLQEVPVSDPGVLRDVDVKDDLIG